DKNWEADGKNLIPPQAVVCLHATLACLLATFAMLQSALALPEKFSTTSYVGSADPNTVWELLIGGMVLCSFLVAVALGIHSSLRKVKRAQVRRNAFISSALNNLSQGVVMSDSQQRIVFC